jgi:feruloyl-CoA synthase
MRKTPGFAAAAVNATRTEDGGWVLASPYALAPHARCLGDVLAGWARRSPARVFLAERDPSGAPGAFRRVTYGDAHHAVRALAQALLDLGAGPARPLMLLSDNGIDHALLQLAAMHVGIPAAPVSPAYSLQSADHVKLRDIARRLRPGVIYASDAGAYARALDALGDLDVPILASGASSRPGARSVDALRSTVPAEAVDRAFASVGPDTIAKVLFTSGSTGAPKGVVNTQRMLCSNQQGIAQLWPFLAERPPVVVDWLPWSHTFGGNHNFNMILWHGGTLYVDGGKPAPGRIETTVANLRDVSPTLYFNVPRGFDMLLPHLEADAGLRASFFRDLDLVFYAAAALPQHLWARLEAVSLVARGTKVTMVSAWGSTETSPLATSVHFPIPRAGVIGLPPPGCALKLARAGETGDKLEMRVRGPNVTPGYWEPGGGVRAVTLDADGFLPTGDAGRLEDPADPAKGVVFNGRIAENFKLSSGTWVSVGDLRAAVLTALAAADARVADVVVAGHDRDALALLLVPGAPGATPDARSAAALSAAIASALAAHNASCPASSTTIARALLMTEPLSIDAGEITDKGYINARAVLERRAALVDRLYADSPGDDVITP